MPPASTKAKAKAKGKGADMKAKGADKGKVKAKAKASPRRPATPKGKNKKLRTARKPRTTQLEKVSTADLIARASYPAPPRGMKPIAPPEGSGGAALAPPASFVRLVSPKLVPLMTRVVIEHVRARGAEAMFMGDRFERMAANTSSKYMSPKTHVYGDAGRVPIPLGYNMGKLLIEDPEAVLRAVAFLAQRGQITGSDLDTLYDIEALSAGDPQVYDNLVRTVYRLDEPTKLKLARAISRVRRVGVDAYKKDLVRDPRGDAVLSSGGALATRREVDGDGDGGGDGGGALLVPVQPRKLGGAVFYNLGGDGHDDTVYVKDPSAAAAAAQEGSAVKVCDARMRAYFAATAKTTRQDASHDERRGLSRTVRAFCDPTREDVLGMLAARRQDPDWYMEPHSVLVIMAKAKAEAKASDDDLKRYRAVARRNFGYAFDPGEDPEIEQRIDHLWRPRLSEVLAGASSQRRNEPRKF
jgi:hypothetical protein